MTRFGVVRAAILRPHGWWYGPAVTLACIGGATLIRLALGAITGSVPFVMYFPAVMLAALLAGWRWGVAATVLAAAVANWLFIVPRFEWALDLDNLITVALFAVSNLIIVAIGDTLRRTFRELEAAGERAAFLNREMRHRVRNTLAVVQALADRSLRSHPHDFRQVFSDRLAALAQAHDVLASGPGEACDLGELVERTCAPFLDEGNIACSGPPALVDSEACVPLALALHELATNAVKHGALSAPGGRVTVGWEPAGARRVALDWVEAGGPPVYPPKRKGLGTMLLTAQPELVACQLDFAPGGLKCRFEIAGRVGEPA